MGVEWNVGCMKCKIHIWLGSQKPYKWEGFQISGEVVKRFLMLHSKCNSTLDGNLLFTHDGTQQIPWQIEGEELNWKEDILSRSFCFDSLNQGKIVCADCNKELNAEETVRLEEGNLIKNPFLWFCDQSCFLNYLEAQRNQNDVIIYDSTKDNLPNMDVDLFEVGCTKCKTFVNVDFSSDEDNNTKNFEYLALFCGKHVGHEHNLIVNIDNENIPWRLIDKDLEWKEFNY